MDTPRKSTRKFNRPPSGPHPRPAAAGRPPTERINRTAPAAPSSRGSGSREGGGGHAPSDNKTTLMVAGGAGGVALLLLIFFMLSGSGREELPKTVAAKRPAPSATPKPGKVDVSRLVRDGEQKCEDGYQIIRDCQAQLEEYRRSGGDSSSLRAKLQRGLDLMKEGTGLLSEANDKSNGEQGFCDKKYIETLKLARGMIGELK